MHRQVCKRIGHRLRDLHLGDLAAYRQYLDDNPDEWTVLDGFCFIPVSRFARDWPVFDCLGREVLPVLSDAAKARGTNRIVAWSVGCARGEEPYTLNAVWHFIVAPTRPGVLLDIVASDISAELLDRAREGVFKRSSLRELPSGWWDQMFERVGVERRVMAPFRENVRFELQDVRETQPAGQFDLILCRNLVLTYFDAEMQRRVLRRLVGALRPGGAFVIGAHERLPENGFGLASWRPEHGIYVRTADGPSDAVEELEHG